jgi:hypothetical protein
MYKYGWLMAAFLTFLSFGLPFASLALMAYGHAFSTFPFGATCSVLSLVLYSPSDGSKRFDRDTR